MSLTRLKRPAAITGANSQDAIPLDGRLSYQISTLAGLIDRQSVCMLAPLGLNLVEWRILTSIDHEKTTTMTQLLPFVAVDRALVSREVTRLEEQGYVSIVTDKKDRRKKHISLTRKGANLHARALRESTARQLKLASALSIQEITALDTIIVKLKQCLHHDLHQNMKMALDSPLSN